jgi:hypothetical protein
MQTVNRSVYFGRVAAKVACVFRRTRKFVVQTGHGIQTIEAKSLKNHGAILVLLLLAAGLTAAGAAIWHQYRQTRRALEYWGTEVADLIGNASSVELATWQPPSADARSNQADPQRPWFDISKARGLVHFRRSLLEDENFVWDDTPPARDIEWDYAVRFGGDKDDAELVFDLDRGLVAERSHADVPAILTARMVIGLAHFFEETLQQGGK